MAESATTPQPIRATTACDQLAERAAKVAAEFPPPADEKLQRIAALLKAGPQ
jgi:hypothetical protein